MDVKYRPEPWQNMGDGMNRITKDALIKLREANESLKRIDGRIRDLDSDGSIHFNPKDQSQKIGELLDSYSTLQKYCGEAGQLVSEHIDKPFLVEMDKFAQKMRDTSILSFETNNRIGSTTTTVLPGAHAGYGSVPQTIQKKKDKITVEDIFRDSPAFDNVLRGEYKELKKQNPDAKLNYEEYKKVVPSTRGFEYKSIEDEQKKLEMVRDIGIGVGIIITTILCPPLGAAAAVVYGGVQIKSGIDGEDWGTHRKLSQEERVGNIIFGGLDAIPVVGAVGKGVKAFKGTSELADLAKLLKFKEGMPGFNPNLGGNVVQSLKENKTLKNALDAMKDTSIPVAVRMVDTGIGVKIPYVESSTVGEVAGKFSKASTAAKGTGNSSKIVNEANLNNIDEFINGTKKFDDVINDYVKLYSEKIISNKTWSWNKSLHGGANLTARQKRMIKEKAVADGLVPDVKVIKADGMRYGFADFKSAGLVVETKQLPERLWLMSDEEQFKWLDNAIGGRPEGMTWHHTEVPGKMELVPFGIHNITIHNGGRSAGMWADAPR
ncbi:toxin [Bacillus thuringiensis serovar nigeriensis]|uniref:HNH endonuclease signature motif containing protein n=1 Tax=Bacillus thuringiensis TaxID=1428 RepID=UPI000A363097|nr:HNH endonuclease [Bacillus thuringiensis]MEC3432459.1 HNH endonuclease [Bacillus cereus]MRC96295.1 HNH endonuclease [Bacillus thuringiensis]OTX22758.1 toxin [Bacillus thuringiensis serovar nigeriensis]